MLRRSVRLIIIISIGAASVSGVEQPKKFWTKQMITAQTVNLSAIILDSYATHHALLIPGTREGNPLVGAVGVAGVKIGLGVGGLGLAYALHRTHHDRAALAIPYILAAPQFLAGVHNLSIGRHR